MIRLDDVGTLRCPACRGPLRFRGYCGAETRLERGDLSCATCHESYRVSDGVARLYREDEVRGSDRVLRVVYDRLPRLHDPLVRVAFPWAVGETETESRARYLSRLQLPALRREIRKRPARILEIGAGTGSNIPLVRERIPGGIPVELWAMDLSLGMLRLLGERMRFLGDEATRFVAADAHALPFPDGFFDRVFHVGAINGYRKPRVALGEMARVARPGTPIVVVDERLDPDHDHGLLHRLFFRWMTIYDRDPHAPVELLPTGARGVRVEQLGRFFYCLTFTAGAPRVREAPRRRVRPPAAGRSARPGRG